MIARGFAKRSNCSDINADVTRDVIFHQQNERALFLEKDSSAILDWIRGNPGEQAVHKHFQRILPECEPGDLFLDIGANAGFYGLYAASFGCDVFFFDPQPACGSLLERNICLNEGRFPRSGKTALVARPVSDRNERITMKASLWCEGTFSVAKETVSIPANISEVSNEDATFTTSTVSIDDLLHPSKNRILAIKVDTEGYELSVLRSLQKLISVKRVKFFVIEVSPAFWNRDGVSRVDVFDVFVPFLALGCSIRGLHPTQVLDSIDKLRSYFVDKDFVQEDVAVSC